MTALIVVALMTLGFLAYVVAPLIRGVTLSTEEEQDTEVEERKRIALLAILELEDEVEAGKLTPRDATPLRHRYEREVLESLRHTDAAAGDDSLEREIASVRARLARGDASD